MLETIVTKVVGVDVLIKEDLSVDGESSSGMVLSAGQTSCGAFSGPLLIGLQPGREPMRPRTGSFKTDGCSGHVLEKFISSEAKRSGHAATVPPLSIYRQFWTALVCATIFQPFRKSP